MGGRGGARRGEEGPHGAGGAQSAVTAAMFGGLSRCFEDDPFFR